MKPWTRLTLTAVGAGLMTVAVSAFISALPTPFNRLNLPLVLACGLIATFRPYEAVAVAVGAGFFWDSLDVSLPGSRCAAAVIAVLLANLVFRRFLANLNWPSFAALNAVSFVIFSMAVSAVAAIANRLSGLPPPTELGVWAKGLFTATGLQVAAALAAIWLSRTLRTSFHARHLSSGNFRR